MRAADPRSLRSVPSRSCSHPVLAHVSVDSLHGAVLQTCMSRFFPAPRVLTLGTLLMVALPPIQAAWACSLVSYDAVSGPVGSGFARDDPDGRVLPSNALFLVVQDQTEELVLDDGTRVLLEPTAGPTPPAGSFIVSPSESVAGLTVELASAILTFSQDPDTKPPTKPVLESVSERELGDGDSGCINRTSTSCDGVSRVDAQLSNVGDDVATADHLVFAIYQGATAEQALQESVPSQWMLKAEGEDDVRLLGISIARGSWVTVSVIDEAGNESQRSAAKRVK